MINLFSVTELASIAGVILAFVIPIIAWGFKMSNTISVLDSKIESILNRQEAGGHKNDDQDARITRVEIDVAGLYQKLDGIEEQMKRSSSDQNRMLDRIITMLEKK